MSLQRRRNVSGGAIAIIFLVVVLILVLAWPEDDPATLAYAAESRIANDIIAGTAASIESDEYLFLLTASGPERRQPSLEIHQLDGDETLRLVSSLQAPVNELRDDMPAVPGIMVTGDTV